MSRWIAETEQLLSQRVPAPPERVRTFYVDLANLTTLHPFLVSVQPGDRRPAADGYVQHYRIRERIPLGPVTLPIRFRARLSVPDNGDVVTDSWQFPRIWLHTIVSFAPEDGGTLLTERIRFSAPRPLARITVTEGTAAHRAMLAGIAAQFG